MLNIFKKKNKLVQPSIEEIGSTIKTIVHKSQKEESFIGRTPHKFSDELESRSKPPEKLYTPSFYKEFPLVTFLTGESIDSPYLIPIGKSGITKFEIYRYTGDSPRIIHDICFQFGCAYEEILPHNIYTK